MPGELPNRLVEEAGPEPSSYTAASSSKFSDMWMGAMLMEFDEHVAAGTFAEATDIPEGCNMMGPK